MRHKKTPQKTIEALEKLLGMAKPPPDEQKGAIIALQLVLDTRIAEIVKECGNEETLRAVAESAKMKSRRGDTLNELEHKVLIVMAAMTVLEEIKRQNPSD
ncbi:MAG: hypothetical protein AB1324_02250 [Candidatus Micrarchaeota archaeon]